MYLKIIIFIAFIKFIRNGDCQIHEFPSYFEFGISTSAYQIEGAWNEDGKGENIWDRFTHEYPNRIADRSTGDIACDSYRQWENDINLVKDLGVTYYRFSISWSRLLPTGFSNKINPAGVRYYNNIIDKLLQNDIEPMVTLYHWDLPQPLQDLGGLTNPVIAKYFRDYAIVVYTLFGDRVKKWITFNEPWSICLSTYENGNHAPGIAMPGIGCYLCSKVLLLAHAKAYHAYDKRFRKTQNGIVGITISTFWYESKTLSEKDAVATERALQMNFGWCMNPIFSNKGDFPKVMKDRIEFVSKSQNFSESRLPTLTPSEIKYIQGTYDFLGLNHYTTRFIEEGNLTPSQVPSFDDDVGVKMEVDPKWEKSAAHWLFVVPWGFRRLLNWIRVKYNNPLVFVTENGYPDKGELNDEARIRYHNQYLTELLNSINDGCNVQRYTLWSLTDNMEWSSGYTLKFGLYYVDFNNSSRPRLPKSSASYYKGVINNRSLPNFTNC
ncbi:myrosinase 1-like [Agrilus planipennis]|uniref:Myrosinase 1-like n=1 Tax=Agrilus planipennis TaxID=224129 RepID=A0A7F5R1X0_AGRPL|nr:myrosinase 1-like [Agrilus planipennis]